jgi:hypothetical protein
MVAATGGAPGDPQPVVGTAGPKVLTAQRRLGQGTARGNLGHGTFTDAYLPTGEIDIYLSVSDCSTQMYSVVSIKE